ncbi:hypothetical protein WJX81_008128 [Elliptochloris bilobata]|uniref:J domain-containing protein n=1 Tax=Elliptochloris bilobata TaxID=381761 RepID=A0AAW1RT08_9CHLO
MQGRRRRAAAQQFAAQQQQARNRAAWEQLQRQGEAARAAEAAAAAATAAAAQHAREEQQRRCGAAPGQGANPGSDPRQNPSTTQQAAWEDARRRHAAAEAARAAATAARGPPRPAAEGRGGGSGSGRRRFREGAPFQPPRPAAPAVSARQARNQLLARLKAAPPDFSSAANGDLIVFAREAGEGHAAALCCEKSELLALAAKCVGAWEVQRILRCGSELQPPARHSFILRGEGAEHARGAYKRLALLVHPDKHEAATAKQAATDAFQLLSEAFKVMLAGGGAAGR